MAGMSSILTFSNRSVKLFTLHSIRMCLTVQVVWQVKHWTWKVLECLRKITFLLIFWRRFQTMYFRWIFEHCCQLKFVTNWFSKTISPHKKSRDYQIISLSCYLLVLTENGSTVSTILDKLEILFLPLFEITGLLFHPCVT